MCTDTEMIEKAKELRAKNFAHAGEIVKDECPVCHKKLMRNWLKHEWCTSFDCDYFKRSGGFISILKIRYLNIKYSKSE